MPLKFDVWDGYNWVYYGGVDLGDDGFVLRETLATSANTGCRIPYASLTVFSGIVTNTHPVTGFALAPGDVITGVRASGFDLTVKGVTVRDCWVDGHTMAYVAGSADYNRLIDQRHSPGGEVDSDMNIFEFVTVDPVTSNYKNVAFQGSCFRAYRCKIRNVTDAFSPHSTGSQVHRPVDIWGCYADDFYIDDEPSANQTDLITHNDFVQAAGKLRRLTVIGCAVGDGSGSAKYTRGRPRTSNILVQNNAGTYTGEGVTVEDNYFRGAQTTGSTINMPVDVGVPLSIQRNVVHSTGNTPRVLIKDTWRVAGTTTISGNVDENGNPTTINNA
jgi:hypothetical protein